MTTFLVKPSRKKLKGICPLGIQTFMVSWHCAKTVLNPCVPTSWRVVHIDSLFLPILKVLANSPIPAALSMEPA